MGGKGGEEERIRGRVGRGKGSKIAFGPNMGPSLSIGMEVVAQLVRA